jgi:Uma2 family endonuclease
LEQRTLIDMSTTKKLQVVSVADYLSGELKSSVKHEYVGGVVYAMAGRGNAHNLIASNTLIVFGLRLRGKPCRAYNSDTKIRIQLPTHVRFYYPDVSVICRPNPQTDSFQDEPTLLVEVLSRATRRLDEGEKKDAYLTLPFLRIYLLIEQEKAMVTLFRRAEQGFVREFYDGLEAAVSLPEIDIDLPLAEIYEGVQFTPELAPDQP